MTLPPEGPHPVDRLADEVGGVRVNLTRIRQLLEPPRLLLKRRLRLTSSNPWIDLLSQEIGDETFGTLIVENPNSAATQIVEVGFTPGSGRLGASDMRVPSRMGMVFVGDFDMASIGIDTAALSTTPVEVFVRLYDKKLTPTAYAFNPGPPKILLVDATVDPPAGSEAVYVASVGCIIHSVVAQLVTSAAIANRRVNFAADSGAGTPIFWQSSASVDQAASLSYTYLGQEGATAGAPVATSPVIALPPGGVYLNAGDRFQTIATQGQPGDNYGPFTLRIERV